MIVNGYSQFWQMWPRRQPISGTLQIGRWIICAVAFWFSCGKNFNNLSETIPTHQDFAMLACYELHVHSLLCAIGTPLKRWTEAIMR